MEKSPQRRRIDVASLVLLVIGLSSGLWAFALVEHQGMSPLIFVPPVVAATVGLTNITKKVAPHP